MSTDAASWNLPRFRWRLKHHLKRQLAGKLYGRLTEVVGNQVLVSGVDLRIGQLCALLQADSREPILGEVVGLSREGASLTLLGDVTGLGSRTLVQPLPGVPCVSVGDALLGRVLDGLGQPIDAGQALSLTERRPLVASAPAPLSRPCIHAVLPTGVRAIDGFLTVGVGQRLGIFAPAGVGKSTLLAMIAKGVADGVCVIALIGERGREVREFLEETLTSEQRARAVIVVSTSDRPSIERIKAAYTATAIAEYFRDLGQHVVLLFDSVTRFARALRETGLAAGEQAVRRGYPPSVFTALPKLVERAGPASRGCITAFYTVLLEDAETVDPIGEEIRSLLDGHIVLSQKLATMGHYPAIDIRHSVSRVMPRIVDERLLQSAATCRTWLAKYEDAELLLQIGEYKSGQDPVLDAAVDAHPGLVDFLKQKDADCQDFHTVSERLHELAKSDG